MILLSLLKPCYLLNIFILSLNGGLNWVDYYPISNNSYWNYSVTEDNEHYKQSVIMTYLETEGQNDFMIETNGKRKSKLYFSYDKEKVYLKNLELNWGIIPFPIKLKCSTSVPVFVFDGYQNEKWTWKGRFQFLFITKEVEISFQILGFEMMDTPVGSMECLKIKTIYTESDTNRELISWFAKGVGLIKEKSNQYEKQLVDFKIYK
jgi:hypothetical protein